MNDPLQSNIIKISEVRPKTTKHLYKRVPIKLIFIPAKHEWQWKITIISETEYSEVADTEAKALKAAQKYIDKNNLGRV